MTSSAFRAGLAALVTVCAVAVASERAQAHATFENAEARQNSGWKGVLRVPHGCDGAATTRVRIVIPEGMIAVKPMPKAGWTLSTVTGPYARSYDYFGRPVNEGVKEIVWSGGTLPDAHYDEFVFTARVTDALPAGKPVAIPVHQACENGGTLAWAEVAADGQDAHALKSPAPLVRITAAQVAQHGGGHGAAHGSGHGAAASFRVGDLTIEQPWTRATLPGAKVAGGYMRITNTGKTADRLIGGSFDLSGILEVHEMSMDNGVMRMRALEKGLEIPPGGTVDLKPGGYHLMFIDLKGRVPEGQKVAGRLKFEKAGEVAVEYHVTAPGARSAGAGEHQH